MKKTPDDEEDTNSSSEETAGDLGPEPEALPEKKAASKPTLQTCCGPIDYFEATEENIPNHPAILAAGKRRTGKSTSLDNLMFQTMQHIPFGMVMSDTTTNGFWQQRVPPRYVFQGWRSDILQALVARQNRLIDKYGRDDPRTSAFIIFDDVIADQTAIRYSKEINQFFVQGRHLNITVLITTQYMKGIGPMVRGNMDIVIIQPIYAINDRETIQGLFGAFIPKKDFLRLMDEVVYAEELEGSTAKHPKLKMQVMVVQDWRQSCEPQKKFKYWNPVHSKELPPYRLCHPKYWEGKLGDDQPAAPTKKRKKLSDVLEECCSVATIDTTFQMGDTLRL